jgi:hypothetical protein
MIVIGEIKDIIPTRFHFRVVIRHAPDLVFMLDSHLHTCMARRFECELSLRACASDVHLMLAATFDLIDRDRPVIHELCLVTTSAHWIPVDDGYELQLIDRLVKERRAFEKALGYNSRMASHSPSAILLDTPRSPIGLAPDRAGLTSHRHSGWGARPPT